MINLIFFWMVVFIIIYFFTRESNSSYDKEKDENIIVSEDIRFEILKRKEVEDFFDDRLTDLEKENLYGIFENRCFKCKSEEDLSTDHHLPISKGYPLKDEKAGLNAVLLCKRCNGKKQNKLPGEFYTKEELLKLENLGIRSHLYYSSKRIINLERRVLSGKIKFLQESVAKGENIKFVYFNQRDPLFVREEEEIMPIRVVSRKKFLYRGWTWEWFLHCEGERKRIFNIRWMYHLEKTLEK
ncbi:HNH endonuclease [uncultured Ilyobacter sp.]|uniref:HNH endonuclease n=1 Tax=uncultured Ilyobacter sp. TaxID=544433 RepID=UPI0029C79601|nr:HNH endonuclease [uncultured Ilyobacter sp.]